MPGPTSAGVGQPPYTGRSNAVPLPAPLDASAASHPQPASIIVSQVAERWVNEVSADLQPETLGGYLRNAIAGDVYYLFQFFEEMEEKWPTLRTALVKHRLKVTLRAPRISPPLKVRNAALAKTKADFASLAFGEILNFPQSLFHLTDCLTKGISLAEIDWVIRDDVGQASSLPQSGPAVLINELRWVNYRHLGYWYDSPELRLFPNLLNRASPIVIPERKFVCVEHLSKSGHPARASQLRPLSWYFLIYLYAIKDWATLAETYGIDVAWATMRMGDSGTGATSEQVKKALMHLQRIAARAGIFEEGTQINLERAAGSGAAPQEALVKYCNEKALETILGQTTTTLTPKSGTQGFFQTQSEEGDLVIDWTALLVSRAITDQPMRWMMDFNFAERGDNPVFELPGANRRDLQALANVLNVMARLGLPIPIKWSHTATEIPEPQQLPDGTTEPVLVPTQGSGGSALNDKNATDANPQDLTGRAAASPLLGGAGVGSFTEAQAQSALDAIRQQAIQQGRDTGAFDELARPLKDILTGKGEPAEMMAQIHQVAGQLDPVKLQGIAKEMFILADLVGAGRIHQVPSHGGDKGVGA